ncbi:MAG: hypothetical protein U1C72_01800, partial [Candidatus Pacearchaeota archaeon]|nr:hypothetical protein [Candidatus Pacearchaeota archaeon]
SIPSGSSLQMAEDPLSTQGRSALVSDTALLPVSEYQVVQEIPVIATAYSSTPDQTDSTPFTTASGSRVRDGIIAANFLPFGTKVRHPEVFGNRIFIVEDRMHPRKKWQVDVWFASTTDAVNFGAKRIIIEVLEG